MSFNVTGFQSHLLPSSICCFWHEFNSCAHRRGGTRPTLVHWTLNQSPPANHPNAAPLLWNSQPAFPPAPHLCPDNHLPCTCRPVVILRGRRVAGRRQYAARMRARFHWCSFKRDKCCTEKSDLMTKRPWRCGLALVLTCHSSSPVLSTWQQVCVFHGRFCLWTDPQLCLPAPTCAGRFISSFGGISLHSPAARRV